jgi:hypothetical protein
MIMILLVLKHTLKRAYKLTDRYTHPQAGLQAHRQLSNSDPSGC